MPDGLIGPDRIAFPDVLSAAEGISKISRWPSIYAGTTSLPEQTPGSE